MKSLYLLLLLSFLISCSAHKGTGAGTNTEDAFENPEITTKLCLTQLSVLQEIENLYPKDTVEMDILFSKEMEEIFDRYFGKLNWRNVPFNIRIRKTPRQMFGDLIFHEGKDDNVKGFTLNNSIYLPHNEGLYSLYTEETKQKFGITEKDIQPVDEEDKISKDLARKQLICLLAHEYVHIHQFKDDASYENWCRYDYHNPQVYAFHADSIKSLDEIPSLEKVASMIQHACLLGLDVPVGKDFNLDDASLAQINQIIDNSTNYGEDV